MSESSPLTVFWWTRNFAIKCCHIRVSRRFWRRQEGSGTGRPSKRHTWRRQSITRSRECMANWVSVDARHQVDLTTFAPLLFCTSSTFLMGERGRGGDSPLEMSINYDQPLPYSSPTIIITLSCTGSFSSHNLWTLNRCVKNQTQQEANLTSIKDCASCRIVSV